MEIKVKLEFMKPVMQKDVVVNKVLYALLEQENQGTGLTSVHELNAVIKIQVEHGDLVAKTNKSYTHLEVKKRA